MDENYSSVKTLGGFHVLLGLASIAIGGVDLFLIFGPYYTKLIACEGWQNECISLKLSVMATPIWCGVWFFTCGVLGLYLGRTQPKTPDAASFLKTAFMCACVVVVVVFAPVAVGIGVTCTIYISNPEDNVTKWFIPPCGAAIAFLELLVALTSLVTARRLPKGQKSFSTWNGSDITTEEMTSNEHLSPSTQGGSDHRKASQNTISVISRGKRIIEGRQSRIPIRKQTKRTAGEEYDESIV